jgi:hypothetical protein
MPKNLSFAINDADPADPYARFYSDKVVGTINELTLPRYGLGNYIAPKPKTPPTPHQAKIIDGLSRAGTRLMGFCRTNLFKRLESAGPASCCPSSGTSCATSSSCTPSNTGWTFPWARRAPNCSTPAIPMKTLKMHGRTSNDDR